MHRLTIERLPGRSGGIATASNTQILLDGRPLRGVRGIRLDLESGKANTATLEMICGEIEVNDIGVLAALRDVAMDELRNENAAISEARDGHMRRAANYQRDLIQAYEGIEDREAVIAELRTALELHKQSIEDYGIAWENLRSSRGPVSVTLPSTVKINESAKAGLHASLDAIAAKLSEPAEPSAACDTCGCENVEDCTEIVGREEFGETTQCLQQQIAKLTQIVAVQGAKIAALQARPVRAPLERIGSPFSRPNPIEDEL